MIDITISWSYTAEHRYESDLDERVEVLIKELCEAVPARHNGSGGGTSFGGEMFASDCAHYFDVPNLECGERICEWINGLIKTYDVRYEATLVVSKERAT
jgi:hypothetical protein